MNWIFPIFTKFRAKDYKFYRFSTLLTKEFNIDTAILLSELSVRAYREPDKFKPEELGLEIIRFIDIEKTHTQLYLLKNETSIFIAFRGTESIKDVVNDLIIIKKEYPPQDGLFFKTKVHHGFLYTFLSVKRELFSEIKEQMTNNSYDIYVTGHSLGAALAILCAYDLKREMSLQAIMYNFGCPRIGNRKFVNSYNELVPHSFRIVNNDDFITNLPKFGYKHVNTQVFIYEDGTIFVKPSLKKRFLERLDNVYHFFSGHGVIDHLEHNYLENLKKIKEIGNYK